MSPAPKWIADAIGQVALTDELVAYVGDSREEYSLLPAAVDRIAKALIERLPIEPMARAFVSAQTPRWSDDGRRAFCAVIDALTQDSEVVELADMYQDASRVLDLAGVPYAVPMDADPGAVEVPLNLAGRIAWLAAQRPTMLQVIQTLEDAAVRERAVTAGALRDLASKLRAGRGLMAESTRAGALQERIDQLEGKLEGIASRLSSIADETAGHTVHEMLTDIERTMSLQAKQISDLKGALAAARGSTMAMEFVRDRAVEQVEEQKQVRDRLERALAAVRARLSDLEEDFKIACGDLLISPADAPTGSVLARAVTANRILRSERAARERQIGALQEQIASLRRQLADRGELAEEFMGHLADGGGS